jgi:hypothetical protein
MRNINFTPTMYRAIAFMTCMMLLMFFYKSKAGAANTQLHKNITIKISTTPLP